jgi:xanthine dehydrogenase accessory factor
LPPDLFDRAAELRRAGRSFALATVVRCVRPASARPGDRALVTGDGALEGWVGGSCAQATIRREGLRALAEGRPRLVRLTPEAAAAEPRDEEGVVTYPMTCHSGGVLEVYVEPFVPAPELVVLGESPVGRALAELAPPLGFRVTLLGESEPPPGQPEAPGRPEVPPDRPEMPPGQPEAPLALERPADAWVVVATMGDHDEPAVARALASGAAYVALVASPKRAAHLVEELRAGGADPEALRRVKAPAGLDLGAVTAPEIALSILAEIVQRRRSAPPPAVAETTARDPICGMEVEVATARWTLQRDGATLYFCSPGCREAYSARGT